MSRPALWQIHSGARGEFIHERSTAVSVSLMVLEDMTPHLFPSANLCAPVANDSPK
jgi:hypothetical protein